MEASKVHRGRGGGENLKKKSNDRKKREKVLKIKK